MTPLPIGAAALIGKGGKSALFVVAVIAAIAVLAANKDALLAPKK